MKYKKIIIIGAGGHSKSLINLITSINEFKILGLIENSISNKKILDYPILGTDQDLIKYYKKGIIYCSIGLGQIKNPYKRIKLFNLLKKIGFKIPTIISKKCECFKSNKIGEGTQIFHNTLINSNVKIGKNCIINSNCTIEHDVVIGNHCHIAPGAIINGGVKISDFSFVGSGAVIKENIKVSEICIVGANSFLKKNLTKNKVYK